jgi:hypothetical protein
MRSMRVQGRVIAGVSAMALALSLVPAFAAGSQAAVNNSHRQENPARQAKLTLPMEAPDRGKFVRVLHERLEWLGYPIAWREQVEGLFGSSTTQAIRAAQRKYFLPQTGSVDQRTWSVLRNMSGDVGQLPRVCRSEAKTLCIDKSAKLIRYIRNGKVDRTVHVRFGVPGLDTPTGTYRIWFRWRNATSGINGPNVPRVPMPYALFFNGDIAVHYSSTFAASGYFPGGGSHGCVNVANRNDAIYLFDQMPLRGLVHVYRG